MKTFKQNLGKVSITIDKNPWTDSKCYDRLVVVRPEGEFKTYISRKPVPEGIALSNINYWLPFTALDESYVDALEELIGNKLNRDGSNAQNFELDHFGTNRIYRKSQGQETPGFGIIIPTISNDAETFLISSDRESWVHSASYDSNSKRINFYGNLNNILCYIDATNFIKDGMIDNVYIANGKLIITFNTEAGKEDIEIPLTDIFNPNNYYIKEEVDQKLTLKTDLIQHQSLVSQVTAILEFLENKENKFFVVNCNISSENVVTTDVTYDELNTAFTQGKHCVLKLSSVYHSIFFISDLTKSGNVFTARGLYNNRHFIVTIYKNSSDETIVTYDIREIQDKLVDGTNIASINNQSLLNGGNINVQAVINALNKLNADFVDDTNSTHKFITAAERTLWNTVTEKASLPFVVSVGINPSDVISVDKTLSELETAYNAGKRIRVQFFSASGVSFEEDATRINESLVVTYVTHAVSDGKHYIVTIYEEDNVTKASYQEVLDSDKQDVISDLSTIRSGAAAGATAVQTETLNSALSNTVAESGVYDVTANNDNAKFASLSALLSSENLGTLIPLTKRKGGMSIKFIQSSDNKYVQFRLMHPLDNASTAAADFVNTANWQGVDDEPTAGSDNLVKSGGVAKELEHISNSNCEDEDEEILITNNDETETFVKVNSDGVEAKSISVPEKITNNVTEDANDRISITDDEGNEEICGITKNGVYVKKIFYKNGERYIDISPYFEKSELSTMNIPYLFYVVNPSAYSREYVVRVFAESYLNQHPNSPVYLNNRRDCAISLKSKLGDATVKNGTFNHTITLSAEGYDKKTITQNVKWVSEKAFDNCKVRLLLFGVSFDAIDYLDDEGKEIEAGGWLTASIEKFLRMGAEDRGVQRNYVSIGTAGIRLENWTNPSEKYPFTYNNTTLYSGGRHEARGANCGVNYLRQPFDFRPATIDYDANVGDGSGSVMWDMNGLRHRVPYNVAYEPTEDYGDFEITEAKLAALRCTPFGKYHHDYTEGLWEHCNTKGWIAAVGGTYSAWTGSSAQKEIVDLCMAYAADNPRYGWYDIDTARATSYVNGQPKDVDDNTQYALNINKYLERYRTMDEEGVKLVCADTNPSGKSVVGSDGNTYTIGTKIITQTQLINCNVCTPTHVIWDMCFNDAGFYLSSDTTGVGGSDSIAMAELFAQAVHSQLGNSIKVGFKSKKVNGSFYPEIWEDIALSQQYNITNRYANGLMRYNESMMEAHSDLSQNINWIPCFPVTIPFASRYLQKFDDFVYDKVLVASCDSFVEGRTDFTHDGIRTSLAMALQIYGWIGYTLL